MIYEAKALKTAYYLAILTVVYNLAEGLVSILFGLAEESLTLFGFGIDSFIETLSATGILYMVIGMRKGREEEAGTFERKALRITGWSFYILSAGLVAGAFNSIYTGRQPESTLPGLVIASLSILLMIWLVRAKRKTGRALHSDAIIADANCNLVCIYMSVVLLVSSGLYHFFSIPYADAAGSLGLVFFSIREGREAFEKARTGKCSCHECSPNS